MDRRSRYCSILKGIAEADDLHSRLDTVDTPLNTLAAKDLSMREQHRLFGLGG